MESVSVTKKVLKKKKKQIAYQTTLATPIRDRKVGKDIDKDQKKYVDKKQVDSWRPKPIKQCLLSLLGGHMPLMQSRLFLYGQNPGAPRPASGLQVAAIHMSPHNYFITIFVIYFVRKIVYFRMFELVCGATLFMGPILMEKCI